MTVCMTVLFSPYQSILVIFIGFIREITSPEESFNKSCPAKEEENQNSNINDKCDESSKTISQTGSLTVHKR